MLRRTALCLLLLCLAFGAQAGKKATPPRKPLLNASSTQTESLVKVLRTTNKAQTNHYVCEALEFHNVNPFNIINYFWAVTSREEGGIYSFANPNGESGYVVVICPEYQLATLRKLAQDLDRPKLTSAPGSKYIYYRMLHRNIADPGLKTVLGYYSGTSGVLVPDVETNSVLIYDAPEGAMATENTLKEILDLPLTQVEITAKIYEISVNNDATLGLDFEAWKNGPGRVLGQYQNSGAYSNISGNGHAHIQSSSNGVFLDYPSAFFDFLVEKGWAKSVINTRIAALNRVPALLTTGEQVFYYAIDGVGNGAGINDRTVTSQTTDAAVGKVVFPTDGRTFSGKFRSPFKKTDPAYPLAQAPQEGRPLSATVKVVDTGLSFAVVPTIGTDTITMDLNLKVVNNSGFDDTGRPLLNSRQMTDSITVANGTEIIFGGLTRERKLETTRKVPLLGSLPIIGYLFGGEISTTKKSIIVTAIQPHLIVGNDNVKAADTLLAKQAAAEEDVVVLPPSEFCFEQSVPTIY